MAQRQSITFRCTHEMDKRLTKLMEERRLDRTSIIKLALYMLSSHMSQPAVRKQGIRDVLADIEGKRPARFPSFATFAVEPKTLLRSRRS